MIRKLLYARFKAVAAKVSKYVFGAGTSRTKSRSDVAPRARPAVKGCAQGKTESAGAAHGITVKTNTADIRLAESLSMDGRPTKAGAKAARADVKNSLVLETEGRKAGAVRGAASSIQKVALTACLNKAGAVTTGADARSVLDIQAAPNKAGAMAGAVETKTLLTARVHGEKMEPSSVEMNITSRLEIEVAGTAESPKSINMESRDRLLMSGCPEKIKLIETSGADVTRSAGRAEGRKAGTVQAGGCSSTTLKTCVGAMKQKWEHPVLNNGELVIMQAYTADLNDQILEVV